MLSLVTAQLAVFTFSYYSRASLDEALRFLSDFRESGPSDACLLLVGTLAPMSDDSSGSVTWEEASKAAAEADVSLLMDVDAKTGENTELLLSSLVRLDLARR